MDKKHHKIEPYKNVLIINLQDRPDRLVNVYQQLDKIGLSDSTIRIKAVDKDKAVNYTDILSTRACANIIDIKDTCIIPNFSALGCAISHMNCWRYIIDNNLDDGLVVEDDIKIINPMAFKLDLTSIRNYIISDKKHSNYDKPFFLVFNPLFNNDRDIDLSSNGYWYSNNYNDYMNSQDNDYKNNIVYQLCQPFTGTYMYYINRYMAEYLLDSMITMTYQLDIEIGILSNRYDSNEMFHAYNTKYITTDNMGTDIQTYLIENTNLRSILRDEHNMPEDITDIVYSYLPSIFTKER